MRLPQLMQHLFERPHMVTMARLVVLERFLASRFEVPITVDGAALAAPESEPHARRSLRTVEGVAVIDVHGTLVQRTGAMDAESGLVSYQAVRDQLEAALADASVRSIVLNLDSPGGEVAGCFALADRIREATAEKPIIGFANEQACSACYAIGAACSAFYVGETACAGSIGVVMAHVDQSGSDAQAGIKVTHLYSGARKVDGNPHEPLSDDARASMQAQIDELAGIFQDKVATWRRLPVAAVKATEAGIYIGAKAVTAGLADGVLSADAVLELAMKGAPMGKPRLEGEQPETKDQPEAAPPAAAVPCEECGADPCECPAEAEPVPEEQAAALRAEGVTAERARVMGLLSVAKHPHEIAAAIESIKAGETVEALTRRLLEAYQAKGSAKLQQIQADMAVMGQIGAAPQVAPKLGPMAGGPTAAAPLFAKPGDDPEDVAESCKAAWDGDKELRKAFKIGGYSAFLKLNQFAARGGAINGLAGKVRAT